FPGSYPVQFESFHLQQLANEEYFVAEKVAGTRYMLFSTHTPKGPACFLIDRHFDISFVQNFLLPLKDSPTKYQNDTLLDGEMVAEGEGAKKTLRFMVFDLMVLNGTVVTQRSYSTRLGMMDQDILAVQLSKSADVKVKEPFSIERKAMQRSYGMNIILSGSKRHKHGGEGLIFVPVRQPYVPGMSPKLLKWKSQTTAQFQIKVTLSRERKSLYCIHVRQGTGSKFYDYVTPEPALATEWHNHSPDGKVAEFWWDSQWPTQMFEKGYGLETRTGGWKYYRARDDKKEVDDESIVLALVKGLDSLVTKEQLESQIDNIRTQWKAREQSGSSSNGSVPRPAMRPLTITNSSSSQPEGHPPLPTPSLSSHYLQSPSVASHSGAHSYFSRKDRERKLSIDEHAPISHPLSVPGNLSHPLPPKPVAHQLKHESSLISGSSRLSSSNGKNSDSETTPSSSTNPSATSAKSPPRLERKHSPSPKSGSIITSAFSPTLSSTLTLPAQITPSASAHTTALSKNPLKLSQIPEHLQPTKPWMTITPLPRTPAIDKPKKTEKGEGKDSQPTGSSDSSSQRPTIPASSSRKSSLATIETSKELTGSVMPMPLVPPTSLANSTATTEPQSQPQTPTPAHTPTLSGISHPAATLHLPPTSSSPSKAASSNIPQSKPEQRPDSSPQGGKNTTLTDGTATPTAAHQAPTSIGSEKIVQKSSPVLGKRTVMSSPEGDRPEMPLSQKRKLSDVTPTLFRSDALQKDAGSSTALRKMSAPLLLESPASVSLHTTIEPLPVKAATLPSPLTSPGISSTQPKTGHPLEIQYTEQGPLDPPSRGEALDGQPLTGMDPSLDLTAPRRSSMEGVSVQTRIPQEHTEDNRSEDVQMDDAPQLILETPLSTSSQAKVEKHTPHPVSVNSTVKVADTPPPPPPPVVSLTLAEQKAYETPSDLEKRHAMARALRVAQSKIDRIRDEQVEKERKRSEEIETLKERARIGKELAQKRKAQEATEIVIQDRRLQPVRQINQQGRQVHSNPDSPVTRAQGLNAQRMAASPQELPRQAYSTRQARANSRQESQSAQSSPKPQSRAETPSASVQKGNGGTPVPTSHPYATRGQLAASEPNLPRSAPALPPTSPTPVPPAAAVRVESTLPTGDFGRGHRRINSMDHPVHMGHHMGPGPGQQRPESKESAERLYGQPPSKRLDVGQHESNHRRSHSDVGVFYKQTATPVFPTQMVSRPPSAADDRTSRQAPAVFQSDMERRREGHPLQPHMTDIGISRKEPTSTKRESKARLQFILNDEDSSPESHHDDDIQERSQSLGVPTWMNLNIAQESSPKANARNVHQQPRVAFPEPTMPEHLDTHRPSQDLRGVDLSYGDRIDDYEYQARQMHPQGPMPHGGPPSLQRPPHERWHQPSPVPASAAGAQVMDRRGVMEGPGVPPQMIPPQPGRVYQPGQEHPQQHAPPAPMPGHPEGPRVMHERPTHSRNSSLSKSAAISEPIPNPGAHFQDARAKNAHPQDPMMSVEQYARVHGQRAPPPHGQGMVPHSQAQVQSRAAPAHMQQGPIPHQAKGPGPGPRKKAAAAEPHPGMFSQSGPPPSSNMAAQGNYEHPHRSVHAPMAHPQHPQHSHPPGQPAVYQGQPMGRHPEADHGRDPESAHPGYHRPQPLPQHRGNHPEAGPGPGYYEHEAHAGPYGQGRSPGPAPPGSGPERHGGGYPPYHPASGSHEQLYRGFPEGSQRVAMENEMAVKEEHGRGPMGRGSMGHLPPEQVHGPRAYGAHGPQPGQGPPRYAPPPPHPQAQPPPQQAPPHHPHGMSSQDFRTGAPPMHHHPQQAQPPPPHGPHHGQSKIIAAEHGYFAHPGGGGGSGGAGGVGGAMRMPSPRHGQVGNEHEANYRAPIPPHGHGGGPGW
ncbi:Dcp1p-Dcp2p decapping enzyme complex alpha subunit, partial [Lunasporangiospora selenospora]